jgi:hypothetical protein
MRIVTRATPQLFTRRDSAAALAKRFSVPVHSHALFGIGVHKYLKEVRKFHSGPEVLQLLPSDAQPDLTRKMTLFAD